MSNAAVHRSNPDNVNVTLESPGIQGDPLFGKEYPCCLCGNALEILFTRKKKPYTTCLSCGIQTFFRGKTGIKRLVEIVSSSILIAGNGSKTELPVILFNRIQQLRGQKKNLEETQGLIIRDPDLENAIRAVDNEIQRVQGELNKLARRNRGRRKP